MDRRSATWLLLGGFAVVLAVVSIAGRRASPAELRDPRLSVELFGPNGASGFADALERFGVTVDRWTRPVTPRTLGQPEPGAWLGVLGLGLTDDLDDRGVEAVLEWVQRGGGVLVAGPSRVTACLGAPVEEGVRRIAIADERLPDSRWRLDAPPAAPDADAPPSVWSRCSAIPWGKTAAVIRNERSAPVVRVDEVKGGGRVVLIADPAYLSNRVLRDSEAGSVLVPLILGEGITTLRVDEYHHGFGERPSLVGATWTWMLTRPPGWAMLHLAAVGLLALLVLGVRFGPALHVVERRRRSPLEHLEALAVGLERSGASATAVQLIAGGLRRRLGRAGAARPSADADPQWLDALGRSSRTSDADAAFRRLRHAIDHRGDAESVALAAHAVEDVWDTLQLRSSKRS
jgi:hypothetical protein